MAKDRTSATLNPFRVPAGPLGRMAGWLMGRDDDAHRELVELLAPCPAAGICEIGFGPGQLLALLIARDPTVRVCGVDPSAVMLQQARRRLARVGALDRADLRLGVAGALPFPDHHVDHVVAVNTAAMWSDLEAGLVDARRVLRRGGSLLIAWHAAASPRRLQRILAQPQPWWNEATGSVRRVFGNAERHDLTYTTACTAVRQ